MPGDQRQLHSPQLPQKSLTFFLSGYYGQGNLGDDLLLRATIEGICRISPAPRFVIRNEGDVALLKGAAVPVELTGIDRIASDQTKSKVRRLVSTLAAYRRHLRQCEQDLGADREAAAAQVPLDARRGRPVRQRVPDADAGVDLAQISVGEAAEGGCLGHGL